MLCMKRGSYEVRKLYACMKENNTEQLISIIKYIENNYPHAEYDGSHNYHIPMWRTVAHFLWLKLSNRVSKHFQLKKICLK